MVGGDAIFTDGIKCKIRNYESSFVGLGIYFLRSALCSYMDGHVACEFQLGNLGPSADGLF